MKTRLLFSLLSLVFFGTVYAQPSSLDYVSGLSSPSGLVRQGDMLYVQGSGNLYRINTASPAPTAESIYSTPQGHSITNVTISGNVIYMAIKLVDATNLFTESRIVSLDLNNVAAAVTVRYSSTQYISALAAKGSAVYFTSSTPLDASNHFTLQVRKIDASTPNPVATLVVSSLTTDFIADDMQCFEDVFSIMVGSGGTVYFFDSSQNIINVIQQAIPSTQAHGIDFYFELKFFTIGNLVYVSGAPTGSGIVASNTAYQDPAGTEGSEAPFNAHFRDVILMGNRLYMTLRNQGKIVYVETTLSSDHFNPALKNISIQNSKTTLTVNGLQDAKNTKIYTSSGQLLTSKLLSPTENTIEISSFSEGIYFLQVENQKSFKFVK